MNQTPEQFEQNETPIEQNEVPKKSDLEEAAFDAGLSRRVVIPKEGTGAYESLKKVCEDYSSIIAQELVSHSPVFLTTSEKKRRTLHAELCVKLYGTSWQETKPEDRDAARRFAHYVAGRPSFAEDFDN